MAASVQLRQDTDMLKMHMWQVVAKNVLGQTI